MAAHCITYRSGMVIRVGSYPTATLLISSDTQIPLVSHSPHNRIRMAFRRQFSWSRIRRTTESDWPVWAAYCLNPCRSIAHRGRLGATRIRQYGFMSRAIQDPATLAVRKPARWVWWRSALERAPHEVGTSQGCPAMTGAIRPSLSCGTRFCYAFRSRGIALW